MGRNEWRLTAVDLAIDAIEPIREMLTRVGFTVGMVAELDQIDAPAKTIVLVADDDQLWNRLAAAQTTPTAGAVAMLDNFDPIRWSNALKLGATPVRSGCTAQTLVEAVKAQARGEVLLPVGVVKHIADTARSASFSELDDELLRLLAAQAPVRDIAAAVGWSERTIRRRLQALYSKIGATSYFQATEAARELTAVRHP